MVAVPPEPLPTGSPPAWPEAWPGPVPLAEPLPAAVALGAGTVVKEPRLAGAWLYWQEQRPQEGGRTTLLRRRGQGAAQELTPAPWNLRSRLHGYGGGAVSISDDGDCVVFVHDGDRCLWLLELSDAAQHLPAPRRLTPPPPTGQERSFADGLVDHQRRCWLGVLEAEGQDWLVRVPLSGGDPEVLHQPPDFCGTPRLSPDGGALAWVQWQQPAMPWEASELWLGVLSADGRLEGARAVAGSGPGPGACSVFQPLWLGDDLVVANDRSGWWNLERLRQATALAAAAGSKDALNDTLPHEPTPVPWEPLLPMQAEFAMPQWVAGMATTAWDGEQLLAAACRQGRWQLGRVALEHADPQQRWQPIDQPFDDLAGLHARHGRLVAVASHATCPPGLLELELATGHWQHSPSSPCPLAAAAISQPTSLWFDGAGGQLTQAWYYPPSGGPHPTAPLLVKGHSGPTAMARTGLTLAIQYWTSRGWGVVDVNYGGSTGFGRAYRERLQGQWGLVDVEDCAAAASAVVAAGWADGSRVAMEGGSAGGFTVLAALCFTRRFQAGACRYAVCDLAALAQHGDHRFEARYLDGLVGPWPEAAATYAARSPLQHADRIEAPVIFFQGLEDLVVPPEQTDRMAAALTQRGVTVEVHRFAGEGHGFRSREVQITVLEATERFFREQFHLESMAPCQP